MSVSYSSHSPLLRLKHPLIQGGMGVGISMGGLAGAVAREGAMGVISTANIGFREKDFWDSPDEAAKRSLQREIRKARAISGGRGLLAVNIMVVTSNYHKMAEIAVEEGIDAIISGAGLPLSLPDLIKNEKVMAAPIVSSAKAARTIINFWHKRYGKTPDFIVTEGSMAGGHLGFSPEEVEEKGGRRFEEEIKRILPVPETNRGNEAIPVVLAGGIYDRADVFHAMEELGATGVQIATRLVTTEECDAPSAYKQAYLNAKKEDIVLTKSPVGMPGRAIRNEFLRCAEKEQIPVKACHKCLKKCDPTKIPYCITDALINAAKGDVDHALLFCGANAWKAERIMTVDEVIEELFP